MMKLIKVLIVLLERFSPFYLSITARKKRYSHEDLARYTVFESIGKEYAIVMQGPIVKKDSFTLETVKLYRYIYPNVQIILSTWQIEDKDVLSSFEEVGVRVIQNIPPEYEGPYNVNLQIKSTCGGLAVLQESETKYVLKTRCDQRCTKPIDFLGYMRLMQQHFPIENQCALSERLVIVSMNTFRSRLYGITDMFMFGRLSDMRLYWDIDFDSAKNWEEDVRPEFMVRNKLAEGYFVNQFFKNLPFVPNWTVADSNAFIRSYFCIIDKEQVDLFWLKYNRYYDSVVQFEVKEYRIWLRREFSDWLGYNRG